MLKIIARFSSNTANSSNKEIIIRKLMSDFKNLYINSDYSNALSVSNKLITFAKANFGDVHISLATAFNNHGLVLKARGDYVEAIASFKNSIKV